MSLILAGQRNTKMVGRRGYEPCSDLFWSHCLQGSHLCHYQGYRDRISAFGWIISFMNFLADWRINADGLLLLWWFQLVFTALSPLHWKEDLVSLLTALLFTFAFDTSFAALDTTTSWETLAPMILTKEGFACSVGVFEVLKGIYAAGSVDYPTLPQRNSAC